MHSRVQRLLGSIALLALFLPTSGCLETPCSRYGFDCPDGGGGGGGGGGGATCQVFPQAATGTLSSNRADATDVWALRVNEDFEELQVLDVDDGWSPEARMWIDPLDADQGSDDCACANPSGCPQMALEAGAPTWVFVEVWDSEENSGADRTYTLNAPGVVAALRVRVGVAHAESPSDYGTTPPGLCDRNQVNSDVQLPWLSEVEGDTNQPLGDLDNPGVCVQGVIDCEINDRDFYSFRKLGTNPIRATLLWTGDADLDFVMEPGGTAQTSDNPETLLASVPANATATLDVSCYEGGTAPIPYALALETY